MMSNKTLDFKWLRAGFCEQSQKMVNPSLPHKKIEFPNYFGVIRHPSLGIILFDTGYTDDFHEVTERFPEKLYALITPTSCGHENGLSQLKALGIQLDDVKYVFISHFHADHICGLRHLRKAQFFYSRVEYSHLDAMNRLFQIKHGFLKKLIPDDFLARAKPIEDFELVDLPNAVKPFEKGYDLLKDGSLIGVPLGGHTVGQLGLFFRSTKGEVLLVADAVWHSNTYRSLVKPHFLTRLLTSDSNLYWKTVLDLNQAHANNPDLYILPSHCSENHSSFL